MSFFDCPKCGFPCREEDGSDCKSCLEKWKQTDEYKELVRRKRKRDLTIVVIIVIFWFGFLPKIGRSVGFCSGYAVKAWALGPEKRVQAVPTCWCDGIERQSQPALWIYPCVSSKLRLKWFRDGKFYETRKEMILDSKQREFQR